MTTINLSDKTKEEFIKLKLNISSKKGKYLSEDDMMIILLDNYKNVKKKK